MHFISYICVWHVAALSAPSPFSKIWNREADELAAQNMDPAPEVLVPRAKIDDFSRR
jgi:hypothetical protein